MSEISSPDSQEQEQISTEQGEEDMNTTELDKNLEGHDLTNEKDVSHQEPEETSKKEEETPEETLKDQEETPNGSHDVEVSNQEPEESQIKEENTIEVTPEETLENQEETPNREETPSSKENDDHEVTSEETVVSPEAAVPEHTITTDTGRVSVFQNHRLHVYEWRPQEEIKAVLYLCHGVLEHLGRYDKLVNELNNSGILVRGLDLVGHGYSEGDRGHIDSIESYITDVVSHLLDTRNEYSSLPLFLMGHSMGGLIAIATALQQQDVLSGLIVSAPGIEVDPQVAGAVLKVAVKALGFLFPQIGVKRFDVSVISSIPEEVEAYVNDPLIYHGALKAGWASAMLKSIEMYRPRINEINIPLLIVHGTEDSLVPFSASQFVNDNASSNDKIFESFQGSHHEILHDREQERARQLIVDWILARLNGPVLSTPEVKPESDLVEDVPSIEVTNEQQ